MQRGLCRDAPPPHAVPRSAASLSLTLAGRWKPARCRGVSGCRRVELSRTWGSGMGGWVSRAPWGQDPHPGAGPYLLLGLPADAAGAVGLGLELAGEGEHLQVGGREARVVPGLLGEVGHCGAGRWTRDGMRQELPGQDPPRHGRSGRRGLVLGAPRGAGPRPC